MRPLLALAIIFLVYAIGDLVATKTKAIISMMLVCSIIFMIAFWCGLPADVFGSAGLTAFSGVTICMFLVHVGSTIKIQDFVKEWKTVLVALCSTVAVAFGIYLIGQFIMDRHYALVGGPCFAGGMVSYLVMQVVGETLGRPDVTVFALLVMSLHVFVGVPVASVLGKKEGEMILEQWKQGIYAAPCQVAEEKGMFSSFRIFPSIPEKYNSSNVILFKTAAIACLAQMLSEVSGINQLIVALVLGVFFHELGILDEGALTKANGFAFVVAGALSNIFSGLANTTPQLILSMLPSLLILLAIGVVVGALISIAVGRLVHFGWRLSVIVAATALFGFPGTYLVSREASAAVGKTEEEVEVVMSYLMPKMIIGGIVSVSVVSGLTAGIMCGWI